MILGRVVGKPNAVFSIESYLADTRHILFKFYFYKFVYFYCFIFCLEENQFSRKLDGLNPFIYFIQIRSKCFVRFEMNRKNSQTVQKLDPGKNRGQTLFFFSIFMLKKKEWIINRVE
jgi:hypothetical protein